MLDLRAALSDLLPTDSSSTTFRSRSTSLSGTLGSLIFSQRGAAVSTREPPEEIALELVTQNRDAERRTERQSFTLDDDNGEAEA
ncbi:hypothetical protein EVJ58_g9007 [Rhodofomes roseus]|uniref:Uncharacterized protein n=1 Tax=Rhodofomes roseus TaxID=34475 RepID=A0A4Y9XXS6_9APHY|nr:hypothetical protein EVJ58_g9007 [Rhodofomes roseus]